MNESTLEDLLAVAFSLMSHEDKKVRDFAICVSILINSLLERSE